MKAEISIDTQEIVKAVTLEVVKALRPLLKGDGEDNTIFTVKTLAAYLQVSEKWVYERVQFKEIPFNKVQGHVRFRKRDIDAWLESLKCPSINPLSRQLKAIR